MAEAVVALPAFALLLGGLGYLHELYEAKIDVNQSVRADVMAHSLSGCTLDIPKAFKTDSKPQAPPPSAVTESPERVDAEAAQRMQSKNDVRMADVSHTQAGASRTAGGAFGPAKLVESASSALCNEKPRSAGLTELVSFGIPSFLR